MTLLTAHTENPMNLQINSVAASTSQAAVASATPVKQAVPSHGRPPAPAAAPAPALSPAATVQITSVPASVPADDRTTYLQILKANGGNVAAALAAVAAMEAKEKGS
jgi:hypothetical protein